MLNIWQLAGAAVFVISGISACFAQRVEHLKRALLLEAEQRSWFRIGARHLHSYCWLRAVGVAQILIGMSIAYFSFHGRG